MMRSLTLAVFLLLLCVHAAGATVRVSYDHGDWNRILWLPGGLPQPGDTVIIATDVTGAPSGDFGRMIIRAHGSLVLEGGDAGVAGLVNDGSLRISRHATLRVTGDLRNDGTIAGEGAVRMTRHGSSITGSGTFGNMVVSSGRGTKIHIERSLTFASLSIGAGNQLLTSVHDLTVNGTYVSGSEFGVPGIMGNGGIIFLNGAVEGSVVGDIVIGTAPGYRPSKRGILPEVHGVLGGTGMSVRFAASREISFSTLIGEISIDSGAVLRAGGIGEQGWNRISGRLSISGELAAVEEVYRWIIEGDLFNRGRIGNCTIVIQGHGGTLRSDLGTWDPGINLVFQGDTGSELVVQGPITVSRLTITPRTPQDSNIVMRAGTSVIKVRHDYTSDIGRGCRIVTDTVVKLWGAAEGIVEGDVLFEGFWGSPIGGRYGGPGADVRFVVRKEIARPFRASGTLRSDPNGHLMVSAPAVVMGKVFLRGPMTLAQGQVLRVDADTVRIAGSVRGGGTFHLIAPQTRLEVPGSFTDSTRLEVGRPDAVSAVRLGRTLFASHIIVNLGSSILYRAGDSMFASRELRYALRYNADFNSASTACHPSDTRPLNFFAGALSVFRFRGDDLGYGTADALKFGEGYFIRFPAETIVWHTGKVANLPMTVPIRAGWNLIGGASIPVSVGHIVVDGTTLLSGFLNAIGGPVSVSVLQPGRGYWVHSAGAGTLRYYPEP